ncbi:protein of unknown function [Paraburkholderia kururiensis]
MKRSAAMRSISLPSAPPRNRVITPSYSKYSSSMINPSVTDPGQSRARREWNPNLMWPQMTHLRVILDAFAKYAAYRSPPHKNGSFSSTVCTFAANELKPERMSVTPAAIQIACSAGSLQALS